MSPDSTDDSMTIAGDRVYVNVSGLRSFSDDGLLSFPVGGGEVTKVRPRYTAPFWIEGDRLVYEEAKTIYSQPLAGGEPEALFMIAAADSLSTYRGPWGPRPRCPLLGE